MSKIMIISDIHVNDYPRYNLTPGSRLRQFDILGDRIVELAKENDCKILFIAGDIIDKAVSRPKVIDKTKCLLDKLGSYFDNVYYILGQHDLDKKSDIHYRYDSVIHSIAPSNFHYMDKRLLTLSGKEIAFMDWRPVQDLTWIEKPVDLFIGHVTVSSLFGQDIDKTKFKLGIVGDIHIHGKVDNLMKIGVPMQHSMSDQPYGTCVIYDTDTGNAKYINTDQDHSRFLRLIYVNEKELEGFTKNGLQYNIFKPKVAKGNKIVEEAQDRKAEIDSIIEQEINSLGLQDVHSEVKDSVTEVDTINFNFKLLSIKIQNFRSISDLYHEFANNTIITGLNGSGKSSFILAIYKGLIGDRQLGQSIKFGESRMLLQVRLEYEGNEYEITRGSDWGLRINNSNEREPYNNKSQFEADVFVKLPFLRYIDSFYFNYWAIEILGSMNNARRVELITKYNRLDILDSYNTKAIDICSDIQQEINSKRINIKEIEAKLQESESTKTKLEESILENQLRITNPKDECESIINHYTEYQKYKLKLSELTSAKKNCEATIGRFDNDKYLILKDKLNSQDNIRTEIKNKLEELSKLEPKLELIRLDITRLRTQLNEVNSEINKVSQPGSYKCRECNSVLSEEARISYLSSLKNKRDKINNEITDLISKGTNLTSKFDKKVPELIIELKEKSKSIEEVYNNLVKEVTKIKLIKQYHDESQTKLSSIEEKIKSLGEPVEEILISEDEITRLRGQLLIHNTIETLSSQISNLPIDEYTSQIENENIELTALQDKLKKYITYRDLVSRNGSIYRNFLSNLSERLSNEKFLFNVVSQRASGAEFFDVGIKYKVDKEYVDYKNLSSGQKTLADLYFISRVITNGGILVLDEYLRFLDVNNHDDALQLIQDTDVNQVIISTHNPNVFIDGSEYLTFELNGDTTEVIKHR